MSVPVCSPPPLPPCQWLLTPNIADTLKGAFALDFDVSAFSALLIESPSVALLILRNFVKGTAPLPL